MPTWKSILQCKEQPATERVQKLCNDLIVSIGFGGAEPVPETSSGTSGAPVAVPLMCLSCPVRCECFGEKPFEVVVCVYGAR